jgi:endonuclease-3
MAAHSTKKKTAQKKTGKKKKAPARQAGKKPARKVAPSKVAPPVTQWPPDATRLKSLMKRLDKLHPPRCALNHENPWQLLQATILSAQCTDERVNKVTPELFRRWPEPPDLAAANPEELQEVIRSTGFYNNKTKSLLGAARRVTEEFGGVLPQTMKELLSLPGVARKTANVVLGTAFGKNEGFVVDTHIHRLAKRLGITRHDDPVKIERDLMEIFPQKKWGDLGHQIIWHGRLVCTARKPDCDECTLAPDCPSAGKLAT